jgi:hypothetical protein
MDISASRGARVVAKLPNISTGGFERVRRGRGLLLALFVAACVAVGVALYLWRAG